MEEEHSKEIDHSLKGREIEVVHVDEPDDLDIISLSSEDPTTIPVMQVFDNSLGTATPDCEQKVLMCLNPSNKSENNRKDSPRREGVGIENQNTAALNDAGSNEACASVNIGEPMMTVECGRIAIQKDLFGAINKALVNCKSEITKNRDNLLRKIDEFGNILNNEIAETLGCKLKLDLKSSIASEQKRKDPPKQNMEDDENVSKAVKETGRKTDALVTVTDNIEEHLMAGNKATTVQKNIFETINKALENCKSEITATRDNALRKIDEIGNSLGNGISEILDNVDYTKTGTPEVIQCNIGRTQDNSQIKEN